MIHTETIEYQDADQIFEGKISWDDTIKEKKPGVLIAHAFGGQSDFETGKSVELAQLGYVGMAIDIYGKGRRASGPDEAARLMAELNNDRALLLKRMNLSWQTLRDFPEVDASQTGAIGFCFGGKCVLDLARSGADVKGVVSFHGMFDKPGLPEDKEVKASILVLHGWEDPMARPEMFVDFANEMTERKADWQMHAFGHTGHAFTNPKANAPDRGLFYQPTSSKRAWQSMGNFFEELFT
jgi:dienelactone hydrolase